MGILKKLKDVEYNAIVEILKERVEVPETNVLKDAFPKQLEFIQDESRLKALFCTRRSAKSYTGGLCLVEAALKNPGVNCLYIGLTRLQAKGIIWKDILRDIDRKNKLGIEFNKTELVATLKNGSVIHVTGIDDDPDEMQKLLGKKYKMVVIDEAASFRQDLRELIYGILKPATVDVGGTVCLMGTSGNLTQGLFYDITKTGEPGWKLFTWSAFDNPYVAKQWQEELDDIKATRPLFMETPLFKQHYLNQWVVSDDDLVYRFAYERNEYKDLPTGLNEKGWNYVLGVDMGFDDSSAFMVAAFHDNDSTLYFIDSFKQSQMDVTDVAEKIKYLQKVHPIDRIIVDGANKQAVVEIQKRHGIPLEASDKREKAEFIEIMNAELIQGRVKFGPLCHQKFGPPRKETSIIDEYLYLIWDERKRKLGKKIEHSSCENHLCDAALYAWRFCWQFLASPAVKKFDYKNPAHMQEKVLEEERQRRIRIEEKHERDIAEQKRDQMEQSEMWSSANGENQYTWYARNQK